MLKWQHIKLTQEQLDILKEKYYVEFLMIGALVMLGAEEIADPMIIKILTEEGLLVRNSSNNDSNPKIYNVS